ncbi:hypothetical protein NKR23_g8937 [Pleurostoma richardsiae]|uniref:Mitochondrial chaperone BCS1 n=1 Tax=Pleurostoma richardsiae TaxID=41990 RepID=A0AA38RGQ6_9PEZI|nr:hypothetical protein NKR23_g8937 [Pleurostoma richardsiae]
MATLNNATPSTPLLASSHVSILDFFVPGSTGIVATLEHVLAMNSYAQAMFACMLLVFLARHVCKYLWTLVETHFASTAHVPYSSEAYDMVMPWLADQPFARRARSSLARVGWRRMCDDDTQKKPLHFSPWNGTFFFLYRKHLFWFRSTEKEVGFRMEEVVWVSCLGCQAVLRQFFNDRRKEYLQLTQNKISIFENQDGKWRRTKASGIRRLSTMIMDEKEKQELITDVGNFLSPDARTWHTNRGIPYRRGYLLYGPPGTGKSSLCLSISGHFDLDIYILNLSSVDGSSLSKLFADLPPRCVLLLEDVDAVGIVQSRQADTEGTVEVGSAEDRPRFRGRLALSDLLNALDGISSNEGRLLLMTTNHIEHLDPALIRAGRADKKIVLPRADKDVTFRIFCMVFKQSEGDILDPGKSAEDDQTVERWAHEFSRKIPEWEFSPAEIQSFLLEHRCSARLAVEKAQQWVDRTRAEREKMKRADSSVEVSDKT